MRTATIVDDSIPFVVSTREIVFRHYEIDKVYSQGITICNTSSQRQSVTIIPPKATNFEVILDSGAALLPSASSALSLASSSVLGDLASTTQRKLRPTPLSARTASDSISGSSFEATSEPSEVYRLPSFGRSFVLAPGLTLKLRVRFTQSSRDVNATAQAIAHQSPDFVPDLAPIYDNIQILWSSNASANAKTTFGGSSTLQLSTTAAKSSYPAGKSSTPPTVASNVVSERSMSIQVVALPASCDVQFDLDQTVARNSPEDKSAYAVVSLGACTPGSRVTRTIRLVNKGSLPARWQIVPEIDSHSGSKAEVKTGHPAASVEKSRTGGSSDTTEQGITKNWTIYPLSGVLAACGNTFTIPAGTSLLGNVGFGSEGAVGGLVCTDSTIVTVQFAPGLDESSGAQRITLRLIQTDDETEVRGGPSASVSLLERRLREMGSAASGVPPLPKGTPTPAAARSALMKIADRYLTLTSEVATHKFKLTLCDAAALEAQAWMAKIQGSDAGSKLRTEALAGVAELLPLSLVEFPKSFVGTERTFPIVLFNTASVPASFTLSLGSVEAVWRSIAPTPAAADESSNSSPRSKTQAVSVTNALQCIRIIPPEGRIGAFDSIRVDVVFAPRSAEQMLGERLKSFRSMDVASEYMEIKANFVVCARESGHRTSVPLHAVSVEPSLRLSPSRINFGACALGERRDVVATLTNPNPFLPIPFEFTKVAHYRVEPSFGVVPPGESQAVLFSFIPRTLGAPGPVADAPAEVTLSLANGLHMMPVLLTGYCHSEKVQNAITNEMGELLGADPEQIQSLPVDTLSNLSPLCDGAFVPQPRATSISPRAFSASANNFTPSQLGFPTAPDGTIEFPPHIVQGPLLPQYRGTAENGQEVALNRSGLLEMSRNGVEEQRSDALGTTLAWVPGINGPNDEASLALTRDARGRLTAGKPIGKRRSPNKLRGLRHPTESTIEDASLDDNSDLDIETPRGVSSRGRTPGGDGQYDPYDSTGTIEFAEGLSESKPYRARRAGTAADLEAHARNDRRKGSDYSDLGSALRSVHHSRDHHSSSLDGAIVLADDRALLSTPGLKNIPPALLRDAPTQVLRTMNTQSESVQPRQSAHKHTTQIRLLPTSPAERKDCESPLTADAMQILAETFATNPLRVDFGTTCVGAVVNHDLIIRNPLETHIWVQLLFNGDVSERNESNDKAGSVNRAGRVGSVFGADFVTNPFAATPAASQQQQAGATSPAGATMQFPELAGSYPPHQLIQPGGAARFELRFRATHPQAYSRILRFSVNGKHSYPIQLSAQVVPMSLEVAPYGSTKLAKTPPSAEELALPNSSVTANLDVVANLDFAFSPESTDFSVTEQLVLRNPHPLPVTFQWSLPQSKAQLLPTGDSNMSKALALAIATEGIFNVTPSRGIVQPGESIVVQVRYAPRYSHPVVVHDIVLHIENGLSRVLRCKAQLEEAKIDIITATRPSHVKHLSPAQAAELQQMNRSGTVDFGTVPAGLASTRAITIKNVGQKHALVKLGPSPPTVVVSPEVIHLNPGATAKVEITATPPADASLTRDSQSRQDGDFKGANTLERSGQVASSQDLLPFREQIPVFIRGQSITAASNRPMKLQIVASAAIPRISVVEPELNFGAVSVSGAVPPELPFTLRNDSSIPLLLAFTLTDQVFAPFDFVPTSEALVTYQQLLGLMDASNARPQQVKKDKSQENTEEHAAGKSSTLTKNKALASKQAEQDKASSQASDSLSNMLKQCAVAPVTYSQLPPHFASIIAPPVPAALTSSTASGEPGPNVSGKRSRSASVTIPGQRSGAPGSAKGSRRQSLTTLLNAPPRIWLIYVGPGACVSPGRVSFNPTQAGVEHHLPLPIYLPSAPVYPPLQRSIYAITVPPRLVVKPSTLDFGTSTLVRLTVTSASEEENPENDAPGMTDDDDLSRKRLLEQLVTRNVTLHNNHTQSLAWAIGTPENATSLATTFASDTSNTQSQLSAPLALAKAVAAADPLATTMLAATGVAPSVAFSPQAGVIPPGGSVDVVVCILPTRVGSIELTAPVFMHTCHTDEDVHSVVGLLPQNRSFNARLTPETVIAEAASAQAVIEHIQTRMHQEPASPRTTTPAHDAKTSDGTPGPYTVLKLTGYTERPWLETDAPNGEVSLPVVPLGVVSRCTIAVTAHGFKNLELRAVLPPETRVPLRVSFPKGKTLSPHRPSVPVQISFVSTVPVSFTTKLDLVDPEGDVPCGILVHGCADNSVLTVLPYLFRYGKSLKIAQPGPSRALMLMPASSAVALQAARQRMRQSSLAAGPDASLLSVPGTGQAAPGSYAANLPLEIPAADMTFANADLVGITTSSNKPSSLVHSAPMYASPNSDEYQLSLAAVMSYLDAAGIFPLSALANYCASSFTTLAVSNDETPTKTANKPVATAYSASAPVSNMGKQRERALTFSTAQALASFPVDVTAIHGALIAEDAALLRAIFKAMSKAAGLGTQSRVKSDSELVLHVSGAADSNSTRTVAGQSGLSGNDKGLHTLMGLTLAALNDPVLSSIVPYGSRNTKIAAGSQRGSTSGSVSPQLSSHSGLPPALAPFEDVIRAFDSMSQFLETLQTAGLMIADIHPTDLLTKSQLTKLLRCPCYQDRLGREALFYILDLAHPLSGNSNSAFSPDDKSMKRNSRKGDISGEGLSPEERKIIARSPELTRALGNTSLNLRSAVSLRTAIRASLLTAPSPARLRDAIRAREQAHEIRSQRAVLTILQQLVRTFIISPISAKTLRQLPGMATTSLLTHLGLESPSAPPSTPLGTGRQGAAEGNAATEAKQAAGESLSAPPVGDLVSTTVALSTTSVIPPATQSTLSGTHVGETLSNSSLPSSVSNVYSVGERALLAWITYHARRGDHHLEASSFMCTNFDSDLRDGIVLAAVVRSHWPPASNGLARLSRPRPAQTSAALTNDPTLNSPTVNNDEQLEYYMCVANNAKLLHTLGEMGLHYQISPEQLAGAQCATTLYFVAYLFHMLPNYTPATTIQFTNSALGLEQSQNLVLRNPSRASIAYQVRVDGQGFSCKNKTITLGPGMSATLPIYFLPRFARPSEGRVMLLPSRKAQSSSPAAPAGAGAGLTKQLNQTDELAQEDEVGNSKTFDSTQASVTSMVSAVGTGLGSPLVCALRAAAVAATPVHRVSASARCYEWKTLDIAFDNPLRGYGKDFEFTLSITTESEPSSALPVQSLAGLGSSSASSFADLVAHLQAPGSSLGNGQSLPLLPPAFVLHAERLSVKADEPQINVRVTFLPWSVGKHVATLILVDRNAGEARVALTGISTPPLPTVRATWAGATARAIEVREIELPARNSQFEQARAQYLSIIASRSQQHSQSSISGAPHGTYSSFSIGSTSRILSGTRTGSAPELANSILLPELVPRQTHFAIIPITAPTDSMSSGTPYTPAVAQNAAVFPPPSISQGAAMQAITAVATSEIIVPPTLTVSFDAAGNEGKRADGASSNNSEWSPNDLPVVPSRKLYPNAQPKDRAVDQGGADDGRSPDANRQELATAVNLLASPHAPNRLRLALRPRQAGAHTSVVLLVSGLEIRSVLLQTLVLAQEAGPTLYFKPPLYSSVTQHIPLSNPSQVPVRWRAVLTGPGAANNAMRGKAGVGSTFAGNRPTGFTGPIEFWVAPSGPAAGLSQSLASNSGSGNPATPPVHAYPLTFTASRADPVSAKLELINTVTNESIVFNLEGASDDPVAVDHLAIKSVARSKSKYTLLISTPKVSNSNIAASQSQQHLHQAPPTPSGWSSYAPSGSTTVRPPTSGPNGRPTAPYAGAYSVECDIPFITHISQSSDQRVVADGKGTPMAVNLMIAPPIAGVYRGTILLRPLASPKEYIWYTVEVEVAPPRAESLVEVSAPLRGVATVVVPVTNPFTKPLRLDVALSGPCLEGPAFIEVPPSKTVQYEFKFAPSIIPTLSDLADGENHVTDGASSEHMVLYSDPSLAPAPGSLLKTLGGAVTFLSPEVGEFWHELKLSVTAPRPLTLPPFGPGEAKVRKFIVANPLSSAPVTLHAVLTDTRHFNMVSPHTFKLPPLGQAEVTVQYVPEPLGGQRSATLVLYDPKHPELGPWMFNCEGVGVAPRTMPPIQLTSVITAATADKKRISGICVVQNVLPKPVWVLAGVAQSTQLGAFYVIPASQSLPRGALSLHALLPTNGASPVSTQVSAANAATLGSSAMTYCQQPVLLPPNGQAAFQVAFENEHDLENFFASGKRHVESQIVVAAYPHQAPVATSQPPQPPAGTLPPATSLRWIFPVTVDTALMAPMVYTRVTGDGSVVAMARKEGDQSEVAGSKHTSLGSTNLLDSTDLSPLTMNGLSWESPCRSVLRIEETLIGLANSVKSQFARIAMAGSKLSAKFTPSNSPSSTSSASASPEQQEQAWSNRAAEQALAVDVVVNVLEEEKDATDVKVRLVGQFAPVRVLQSSGTMTIYESKTGNVLITFPVHLKATAPHADDSINLRAAPGHRAVAKFELVHPIAVLQGVPITERIPFRCRIVRTTTPAAAALFDAEPSEGYFVVNSMESHDGASPRTVKPVADVSVVYSPMSYSPKPMLAELEVSSPYFTWRYRLVGDRPKYKPPPSASSSVGAH